MRTDDVNSFTAGSYSGDSVTGELWNYGIEIWCNLEGQYVTFVADLAHLSGEDYEMSICSLGVMGAEYYRSTPLDSYHEVHYQGLSQACR